MVRHWVGLCLDLEMNDSKRGPRVWHKLRFKSFINHKYLGQTFIEAGLAQSVERRTLNPVVVGSSPTVGASFFAFLNRGQSWRGCSHCPPTETSCEPCFAPQQNHLSATC
jgi:hypothetical protein